MIAKLIARIPAGYSVGFYYDIKYGITKTIFNNGRSCKLFAQELGGNDFISLNFYQTAQQDLLKPCEMPEEKVVEFLKNVILISSVA